MIRTFSSDIRALIRSLTPPDSPSIWTGSSEVLMISTAEDWRAMPGSSQVKQIEGERLLKQIRDDDYVILLDLAGKEFTSEALDGYVHKILKNLNNKLGIELRS